ncbi:MAG: signal peptidase II [Candidatus Moraniibacteriota bacterium]
MNPICNPASAWGLISNQTVIKLGGFGLLLIILYLGYNAKTSLTRFGWTLVFIGGASNLYERVAKGCIMDYWKPLNWYPAFNMADVFIVCGILLITIEYLRRK